LDILATGLAAMADFAPRVHDAVPWERRTLRQVEQGITDLACMLRCPRHRGDLAVGHDVPSWDCSDNGVDSGSDFAHEIVAEDTLTRL
jgi:hypothetical protein